MLATLMQVLDTTIANVALPHMQGSLGATQDQITWVLTSYILASAIMMTLISVLVERWGRKRLFIISIVGFTITSMLCGIADSLNTLVFYRLLQGIFGACFIPLSQLILLDIYPPEKHGFAFALWGMGIMIGPILGPIVGGYLTECYSWRWVFYVNVPFGILAFLGLLFFLKESVLDKSKPFDRKGFLLLSLFLTSLQLSLDRGEQLDWLDSVEIKIEVFVTLLSLYFFIAHSLTTPIPFFSWLLFKDYNFMIGLIVSFVVGVILQSTLALTPSLLQNLMFYPVVTSGLIMVPRGIGTLIAMMVIGKLVEKVDTHYLILLGFIVTGWSLNIMTTYTPLMGYGLLLGSGTLLGFGLGFIFVPLSTLAFSTLMPAQRSEAAGLYNLTRTIGGSVGIALVESFLTRSSQRNHAYLTESISPYNKAFMSTPLPANLNPFHITGLAQWEAEIIKQSSFLAYLNSFKILMVASFACAIFFFFIKKKPLA